MKCQERLNELIIDSNIDVEVLSNETNIGYGILYSYLRGECFPSLKNAIILSDYFKVSIDYIVGLSDNDNYTNKKLDKSFSDIYTELLKSNKTTNSKVAKCIGISKNLYSAWRLGSIPEIGTLIKLAQYFHVSIDYLIGKEY